MSTLKKLLALTLALAMVLSVSVFAGNYSEDTYADAELIDEDCAEAVEVLYALNIMTGDDTTGVLKLNPNDPITRAQMVKMIYVILNNGSANADNWKGNALFTDVADDHWGKGFINWAGAVGLVDGNGDGTFAPDAPLTTAAAAKMLLTAIGYDAEAYGFVGPYWEKNVLSAAYEVGLLNGYEADMTGAAARQWVAKMVMNALGAYTYKVSTALPGNGFLGNFWVNGGIVDNDVTNIITFGEKYMNVAIATDVLVSVKNATLGTTASTGVAFAELGAVADTGLGFADLGQEFTVVYKISAKGAKSAVSVRNTGKSVVAESYVTDVEYELTYGTSVNNEKNVYEFTVGELTGPLADTEKFPVLVINYDESKALNKQTFKAAEWTVAELKAAVTGVTENDIVRAIDSNNDGVIDYVVYIVVNYAQVNKVGTSTKYGDYIRAIDIKGEQLKVGDPAVSNGLNQNLYVDHCFTEAVDVEVYDFVKFVWNVDDAAFDIEVLPIESNVKFESRKILKNEYTFDGVTYAVADNAFDGTAAALKTGLGTKKNIVVDGDLLVALGDYDSRYTDMAQINEQLAVLITADIRNADLDNNRQVLLMTADGEIAWYTYDYKAAVDAENTTANKIKWSDIFNYAQWGEDKDTEIDMLCVIHTTDDGLWLEKVVDGKTWSSLAEASEKLVDKAVETVAADECDLVIKEGKPVTFNGTRVSRENIFFAKVDGEYSVITMNDLSGTYKKVSGMTLVKEGDYYDTTVGGFFVIGDAYTSASADVGYLWVTDLEGLETSAGATVTVLKFGADAEIDVVLADGSVEPEAYGVYTYEVVDKKYKLSTIKVDESAALQPVVEDEVVELWISKESALDLTEYDVVGMKVITSLRAEKDGKWEVISNECYFTDADEVLAFIAECEELTADANYTYEYAYRYVAGENTVEDYEDLVAVVININMVANDETID